jgi:hypothetical protein
MKNTVILLSIAVFLLLLIAACGGAFIQLYDPATETELVTLHGAHITPGIIGYRGSSVYIDYTLNRKVEGMTYSYQIMQLCGGLHNFTWPYSIKELKDHGIIYMSSSVITNNWEQQKVTAHGYGVIGLHLKGHILDEAGKKQKGWASNYLSISVEYD